MKVGINATVDSVEYARAEENRKILQLSFSAYVSEAIKEMNDRCDICYKDENVKVEKEN